MNNLKISHSIVPTSFEKSFPVWDKYLYNNISYLNDSDVGYDDPKPPIQTISETELEEG